MMPYNVFALHSSLYCLKYFSVQHYRICSLYGVWLFGCGYLLGYCGCSVNIEVECILPIVSFKLVISSLFTSLAAVNSLDFKQWEALCYFLVFV